MTLHPMSFLATEEKNWDIYLDFAQVYKILSFT